ncbi:MAG: glycoside hydrolase family 130 protein [Planctomycetes bacterium]|nr:glycoside hydrolase family 130 protein [Planctomycetota bacterium]
MSDIPQPDILQRFEQNPIITAADIPFTCNTVFNGSTVKIDGRYYILLRVEGQHGHSVFALGRSDDGYHFEMEPHPVMTPAAEGPMLRYEEAGIEDPRVTVLEGTIYVFYTAFGSYGACMAVATTEDFTSFERIGLVSGPNNKDGVLFPRKVQGRYVRLDRPVADDIGRIWISFSEDLIHWGRSQALISPREGHWDSYRVGASTVPIETEDGWLEIYHGIKMTSGGPIYRAGVALLDKENPANLIGRSAIPILAPRTEYERIGDINNVVYPSAAVLEPDGEVKVYYGAADTYICVATTTLDELIEIAGNREY